MTGKTTIEWTDQPGFKGAVWNPTTGCTRVSAGCDNCYAFALHDKRYAGNLAAAKAYGFHTTAAARVTIDGQQYAETSDMRLPWPRQYDLPFSRVQLLEDRLDVPLRTRTPTCYFVDSMADLFHEDVPDYFIEEVFASMAGAERHRFLILTKRPERMAALLNSHAFWDEVKYRTNRNTAIDTSPLVDILPDPITWTKPLPNVWLGTSVEDQRSADERIPHLLATPAAVRFLSCEPLIGPVDLRPHLPSATYKDRKDNAIPRPALHWVIVGGESGPRGRSMDLEWAMSLVMQCRKTGVVPFVKQLGAVAGHEVGGTFHEWPIKESHGRDMAEWPEDLRIREFPR